MSFKRLALLTLLPVSLAHAADKVRVGQATYTFEDRRFAGVFERTLILGHTISADFLKGIISLADGPGTVLSRDYAGHAPLANLAEPRKVLPIEFGSVQDPLDQLDPQTCAKPAADLTVDEQRLCEALASESHLERYYRRARNSIKLNLSLETGLAKMGRLVHQIDDDSARSRRLTYMNDLYQNASCIVGIDALYMSATSTFNECADVDVRDVLREFLGRAHRDGKVVILGNVPKEEYESFSVINKVSIAKQIESCRTEINEALTLECKTDRNCYVVDLEKIVAHLNNFGFLKLKDGSLLMRNYRSRNQVRPDGVNLSDRGVQVIVEDILRQLAEHPPRAPGESVTPL